MQRYVVGLLFTPDGDRVVLLKKMRARQDCKSVLGLLNGPGGLIEEGESPAQAMSREVEQETGVKICSEAWVLMSDCTYTKPGIKEVFFLTVRSVLAWRACTKESEPVGLYPRVWAGDDQNNLLVPGVPEIIRQSWARLSAQA